jgi:gamma-glutamyltranspeptidase
VGTAGDYTVYVPGAPSGGPLLLDVLSVLGSPQENPSWWSDQPKHLQRLAETLRLASLYHTQLGKFY